MDSVFGGTNFRNEITWKRSHPKGLAFTRFASIHDVIFSYVKDRDHAIWNQTYTPHNPKEMFKQYNLVDENERRYQLTSLLNPNPNRPNLTYEFLGVTKVWRWTQERMMAEYNNGRIIVPKQGKGIPRYKRYLDEQEGIPIGDSWDDIGIAAGKERLGYPTQKPLALLERIIKASSNEGDLVLDPFCGCGTTVVASEKLQRRWIGIDVTHLAIALIKKNLLDNFGDNFPIQITGEPVALPDAERLAAQDAYQFQWWALGLVGARPVEQKKGADRGIDGKIVFFQGEHQRKAETVIISVKSGHLTASHVRDLRAVVDREKAAIGVMLSLHSPTKSMKEEAASSGHYYSELWNKKYPKIQLLTIENLLGGTQIDMPPIKHLDVTFNKTLRIQEQDNHETESFIK
jgi:site-specific DNA-methyltransferase (adenine-specific)